MKLEEIHELWAKDSKLNPDPLLLIVQSSENPYLHAKYHKILSEERLRLQALLTSQKELKLDVFKHIHGKLSKEELVNRGWEPFNLKILSKSEEDLNLEAHPAYIESVKRIALQKEKVDLLESILKTISTRQFLIKSIIDLHKFNNGIG